MLQFARPPLPSTAETAAWGHFWKYGGASRCIPNETSAFRLVSDCWKQFARSIPAGRVLDLGTGLGYVLSEIGGERSDLELVGVDNVPALARPAPGLRIHCGVAMEQLPFADARFDAVCSQFGFEYSDIPATAAEVGRVLRRGGKVQLLVHHADGIVVRQSARRKAALEWVIRQSGIFERAARLTSDWRSFSSGMRSAFGEAAVEASHLQLDPVAPEVASAVRQLLTSGERTWAEQVESGLARLNAQARSELVILAALERVALDEPRAEAVLAMLAKAGLEPAPLRVLEVRPGLPFAWLLQASKPA